MPTSAMARAAARRSLSEHVPQKPVYGERPSATSSPTVMQPVSGFSVSTMPTSRASSLGLYEPMSLPRRLAVPAALGRKPASVRSSVDLPAPLGPMRQVSSPLRMVAVMPEATAFVPFFDLYPMLRLSSLISLVSPSMLQRYQFLAVKWRRMA